MMGVVDHCILRLGSSELHIYYTLELVESSITSDGMGHESNGEGYRVALNTDVPRIGLTDGVEM